MSKYQLLRQAIGNDDLLSVGVQLQLPPAAQNEQLLLVHDHAYLQSLIDGTLDRKIERKIGFPFSPQLVERSRRSVGATLAASRAALVDGIGVNLAGGTHHAFADRGEGFCVFNDSAVTLKTLQMEGLIKTAIVIDTDVHQGNGTASVLSGSDEFFTVSLHGAKNYPFRKETSDLDVPLPDGTDDRAFLEALSKTLESVRNVEADLLIFQSGADPYKHDKLGRLSLSKTGMARRDAMVFRWAQDRQLPVAVTMGGGYAPKVADIVEIHLETVRQALLHFDNCR